MRGRIAPTGHGPVRYASIGPEPGLPVLGELAAVLAAAAGRGDTEPPGGGRVLLDAACGYWGRRGLPTARETVVAAPGPQPLLLALAAAVGGDVLLPRPCPAWWAPQVRLLGRQAYSVPTPAECGGVPDPYALLETVRRVRSEGGDPRLVVLSVADDPTATVPPPEVLHDALEAALGEGLHVVSDETWRDTVHRPQETVLISPAEMHPHDVTVLSGLSGGYLPADWPAGAARFPATADGAVLRSRTLDVLTALGAFVAAPVAAAAAHALGEPTGISERLTAAVRLHARVADAVHQAVLAAGAMSRPPQTGRHLYVEMGQLSASLAARGVTDAMELEDHLTERLGMPTPGGHRFGDELGALRVRLSTGPFLGATGEERLAALDAADPLELPYVAEALRLVATVLGDLRADRARGGPPR
ncbi:Aspartate aminotransferase [Streptomyces sp. YIM 130001]|uniref:aminotransferase class I/II-fold pyridoxal phosphate-dependent enzyme n=1 Tax=Streptomyces sp. YIM 130001 TaxID=2259644 RepID=UPI000E650143|nr:aminotransferase class I/II-fold pyridoxal phosphate-dependent enzyme [Streptomyces sp. YIM 130001]RII12392.1 Aspartate aminotransferase [Streptomyces sp. YIM 130001]